MKNRPLLTIALLTLLVIAVYWVFDSVWAYFSYEMNLRQLLYLEPLGYADTFFLQVSPYQKLSRMITILIFTLIGILVGFFIRRQKRAEETLRQSETRYRTVVDNIGIGVSLVSPQMVVLAVNRQLKEWFPDIDITQTPVCYRVFNDPPSSCVCDYCPVVKTLEDGLVHETVTQTPYKGAIVNYRIVSSPIKNSDDEIIAAIELVEDVTRQEEARILRQKAHDELENRVRERTRELTAANEELKQTQAKLIQSARMNALGELAAGVAHEINNPLTPILTHALLMEEQFNQATPDIRTALPDFPHWIDVLKIGAERCRAITENLLVYSRQPGAYSKVPLDIKVVLTKTLDLVGVQLRNHNIKLIWHVSSDLPKIMGNEQQLQQVFTNIIMNAVYEMKSGGQLTIGLNMHQDEMQIYFSDTGPGIPEAHLDKIFEPFFSTKPAGKGTGLGLSIAYGIIKEHNGEINVKTGQGQGTQFDIRLPAMRGDAATTAQRNAENAVTRDSNQNFSILVVDDEYIIRESLKAILQTDFEIHTTGSPQKAIEIIKTMPIQILLVDLVMDDMHGLDLLSSCLALQPNIIPIIITGYASRDMALEALKKGAFEIIEKPFGPNQVKTVIQRAVQAFQIQQTSTSSRTSSS